MGTTQVDFQGVSYSAGVVGYLIGGDRSGAATMAKMVTSTASKCPETKIVMGGYSQGAQVAHLAAAQLSKDVKDRVVAIIVFGDPDKGVAIPGIPSDRIHTVCALTDPICYGIPIPLGAHLEYGFDSSGLLGAANFVKTKVSSATSSGSAPKPAPKTGLASLFGRGEDLSMI
jgi:cutinase